MSKSYFNRSAWQVGRKAETSKKNSGNTFFSSKDGVDKFDNFSGQTLKIVGLQTVKGTDDVPDYNVVMFDDGHQLSTSRFFTAKGLKWPVGGNAAKYDYITACLVNGTVVEVTPDKVVIGEEQTIKNGDRKGQKFSPVTYYFEEKELPSTDMSIFEEKSE